MYVLYDTTLVHPLERYEYARAGAASELAPVAIHGRAPRKLDAMMSIAKIGDFTIEAVSWTADSPLIAHRTDRLIRTCDPEAYRLYLSVNGGARMEQAGSQISFGARDMALYDLSRPWQTEHSTGPVPMRLVMLTFPRALVPVTYATVAPLAGTLMPKRLPGSSLLARFLIQLTDIASMTGTGSTGYIGSTGDIGSTGYIAGQADEADLAGILRECTVGLIRQRLGQRVGIAPHTRRLLHLAHIRGVIGRRLGNPALDPASIAQAANISPRYLHKLFHDSELTPMQLLKRLRLEQCRRTLLDPAWDTMPVNDIAAAHGYRRSDQFARDFRQLFGVSAIQVRRLARQRRCGHEG